MKYKFKTKPYDHQLKGFVKLWRNGYGGALLMDPRTGKSKVFIDFCAAKFQTKEINRVLIICPNHVIDVWKGTREEKGQIEQHCPVPYNIYVWDQTKRKLGLPEPRKGRLLFVLVNYEAFQMPGKRLQSGGRSQKTGRIKNRNEIRRWANDKTCIGLDESHSIAAPGARRSTVIVSLQNNAPYRVLLTGTPVRKAKKIQDIYMQWKFLNPERFAEWPTFDEFKRHFGIWYKPKDVPVEILKKPINLQQLHELMFMDSYSVAREDCFDLPESDEEIVRIDLSRSARAYDQMANQMVAYIRQHTADAPIPLVKLLRLAQITSGHVKTDRDQIIRVGREKLDAILPRLYSYMENEERVVIAARFKPDLDLLITAARKLRVPVFVVRGGMKRSVVSAERAQARKIDGPLIYIVQPHAVAHGIDLAFCSRMVWYSLTNSFVYWTQCCDRIALSRKSTTFTYLLARGTIDEIMYEELKEDGNVVRAVKASPERLLRV